MKTTKLRNLILKPTFKCFCNCLYCEERQSFYRNQGKNSQRLDLARIKMLLREANELGTQKLQLSGGDPLLFKDIVEIIKEANKFGWFIFMNSTGKTIDKKFALELLDAGLSAFNVSLDTADEELHDKYRGVKGTFASSVNALKIFSKLRKQAHKFNNFYTNIQTVVNKENFRKLPELFQLAIDNDVSSVYLMHLYNYQEKDNELFLLVDDILEFKEIIIPRILKILNENKMNSEIIKNAEYSLNNFYNLKDNKINNFTHGQYWTDSNLVNQDCKQPENSALILPNGNVLPCCIIENNHEIIVGNVFAQSLEDIWQGRQYSKFRKNRSPFCKYCPASKNKTIGLIPSMLKQFN